MKKYPAILKFAHKILELMDLFIEYLTGLQRNMFYYNKFISGKPVSIARKINQVDSSPKARSFRVIRKLIGISIYLMKSG